MDSIVKMSIDSRKQAFTNAYKIEDKKYLDKIEDLFNRINEFGETVTNSDEFETKFATSPLNQEYINLFTEIATNCTPITYESDNSNVQSTKDYIIDDARSEVKMALEDITMPARHAARTEFDDKVRDIPVIGDAIQAKQTFDLFKKFKKNKEDK
jgi:hypothetical protein